MLPATWAALNEAKDRGNSTIFVHIHIQCMFIIYTHILPYIYIQGMCITMINYVIILSVISTHISYSCACAVLHHGFSMFVLATLVTLGQRLSTRF